MTRSAKLVAYLTIAILAGLSITLTAATADTSKLKSAKTWAYQLQGDVGPIASSRADLAVVDPDHAGSAERFRTKAGGARRTVLAYLSIGEAERGRPYWTQCCSSGSPSWLTHRTQGWADNYIVKFWQPAWKAIVRARVKRFLAQGYDGLYLDRVDTYENVRAPGGSRAAMIAFVREIAAEAHAIKPDVAIVTQNAEELLTSDSYVAAIDGVAKEDLFHGADHDGARNPSDMVTASVSLLQRAKSKGKSVFVVEYLSGGATQQVASKIRAQGFVPTFAGRSLAN